MLNENVRVATLKQLLEWSNTVLWMGKSTDYLEVGIKMLTYLVYQMKVEQFHFKNYIYFIVNKATNKVAIVDPSWNYSAVINLLEKLKVKVDAILLTHSHFDHVYMTKILTSRYTDAKVYMSKVECQYYGYTAKNLVEIHDKDIIKLGDTDITCLLTPGHTKGSVCYLLEESLFTGDTIFVEGCGICNTLGGNPYDMYNSIQKIKKNVDPSVRIYAGHSFGKEQGYKLDEVAKQNIYFNIEDVEIFVAFRNRKGQNGLFNFK